MIKLMYLRAFCLPLLLTLYLSRMQLFTEKVREVFWTRRVGQNQKDQFSIKLQGPQSQLPVCSQEGLRGPSTALRVEGPRGCIQQHGDHIR